MELKEQCGKLTHLSRHTTADKLYRISTLFSTISHENLTPEGILIHTIIHYIPALYRSFVVLYYCQKKKIKIRNVCMYVDLADRMIKKVFKPETTEFLFCEKSLK